MKRNTLLLSVLGVLGLLAAWYFLVRKASAADPLADALTSGNTSTGTSTLPLAGSNLGGTGGTDLVTALTGLVTSLTSTSPASTSPAATATPSKMVSWTNWAWKKVKQGANNLWTEPISGKQTLLPKGHNPNIQGSLTWQDMFALSQEPPTVVVAPNRAVKVKPGFTIPAGVTPPTNPAPAPASTRNAKPVRTK